MCQAYPTDPLLSLVQSAATSYVSVPLAPLAQEGAPATVGFTKTKSPTPPRLARTPFSPSNKHVLSPLHPSCTTSAPLVNIPQGKDFLSSMAEQESTAESSEGALVRVYVRTNNGVDTSAASLWASHPAVRRRLTMDSCRVPPSLWPPTACSYRNVAVLRTLGVAGGGGMETGHERNHVAGIGEVILLCNTVLVDALLCCVHGDDGEATIKALHKQRVSCTTRHHQSRYYTWPPKIYISKRQRKMVSARVAVQRHYQCNYDSVVDRQGQSYS